MMRGDSATITVTLTDEDGYPLDLDSLSGVRFTARRWYDSGDPWISKDLDDGITITDPDVGVAEVALVPSDTSELAYTCRLVWDVQVEATDPAEETRTVARGYLWVHRDASL
jgi:hypothetical protein